MTDHIEQGVCPDCEDPSGFDTCSVCRQETDGFYDDDEGFMCYGCAMRGAEAAFDPRWEHAPEPEEWDLPF